MLLKQLALLSGGLVGLTSAIPLINVLVLSTFDATGVENQVLRNNGFNVTGVSTSQFQSMSLEDLGRYNGIFISDAGVCDPNQLSFLDTATSEKLAKAVSGRIELIGTSLADERARRLAINASADLTDVENFALDAAYRLTQQPAIGLYLSLGCYYSNVFGNPATVPALSGFGTFAMRAPHQSPPSGCVSSDATYRGGAQPVIFPAVTEAQLRAWQCAVREVFIDRPDTNSSGFDWIITSANAETPNPAPPGAPYVLGREMVAPACGNGWIDRAFNEECDFGLALNGLSNSNCDANCQCAVGVDTNGNCLPVPNVCGNGVVDTNSSNIPSIPSGVEQCDLGIQLNGQPGSTCDVNCQCVYGRTANNSTCAAAPVSSTTTTSATSTTTSGSSTSSAPTSSATSQSSTVPPTSTQSSSTGSPSTVPPTSGQSSSTGVPPSSSAAQSSSTGTQSASPSSSVDPLPPRIGQFAFKACTGSVQNYPSFELQFSSNQMTLEMCIAGCAGSLYSGTHVNDCYCANAYDAVIEVARDRCSIPCPGNALENCGGYRGNSTNLLRRYDTRRQATGSVPANALLAIYEYSPLATSSAPATTAPTTAAQSTSTGTTVVTAVATVTATPNGGGSCATGFCNAAGYFFELCQGGPRPGEVVFVIEACSCAGGFRYVPAGCSGTGCGSLVVYRAVPWAGGDNGTVYQPQACSSASGCAGGVVFQQNPPAPTANATGVVVVVAGATKLVGYLSSAMAVGGSLLLAALV